MAKKDFDGIPLINKTVDKTRFELVIEKHIAFMDYILSKKNIIYLTHTEVPAPLEGQGVGSALVAKVFDFIRKEDLKVAPLCPFVAAYLKRHPELADGLLAPGYSIG